jgi:uncharacterized protein (DUF488 family)
LILNATIYTVGHSTHTFEQLLSLLKQHEITAIADVRSQPYSRLNPQFSKEPFKMALRESGLSYVFLGAELGARTDDASCYVNGKIQYERLARTSGFQRGLDRLRQGTQKNRIAIMCAEKEPLACHRTILISRHLREQNIRVSHILENGILEDHDASIERLLKLLHLAEPDMFRTREELVSLAYTLQGDKIAYSADEISQTA